MKISFSDFKSNCMNYGNESFMERYHDKFWKKWKKSNREIDLRELYNEVGAFFFIVRIVEKMRPDIYMKVMSEYSIFLINWPFRCQWGNSLWNSIKDMIEEWYRHELSLENTKHLKNIDDNYDIEMKSIIDASIGLCYYNNKTPDFNYIINLVRDYWNQKLGNDKAYNIICDLESAFFIFLEDAEDACNQN